MKNIILVGILAGILVSLAILTMADITREQSTYTKAGVPCRVGFTRVDTPGAHSRCIPD